jgi:photosystem II stability/assembly factor-like uncharacterized protein
VVGDSIILKTTNRGVSWLQQTSPVLKLFYSVFFINPNTGWITGYSTLKTTNGGIDWISKINTTNRRSIFFNNPDTGWVVGGSYTINRSTDGGETWGGHFDSFVNEQVDEIDSPPATYTCIHFMNANTGCFTSSHSFGGRIMMTTNAGMSWITDYPTTRGRKLNEICMRSMNSAWAVGEKGTILSRSSITQIGNSEELIPAEFTLHQNYPNPFNPVTIISFDIPQSVPAKISVFDVSGKEVSVLLDGMVNAGKYNVTWDGSAFSSGVYFCRLTAGGRKLTKQMILIK